jgi:ATP-dependent Lon protease
VADQIAAALGLPVDKELTVLRERDVTARLRLVADLVAEARELAGIKAKVENDVRREFGKNQRDALLREQIRALRKELGEDKDPADELASLRQRLDDAGLSEDARAAADRELRRLEGMNAQQAEAHVIRSYLEWLADLPWSKRADAKDDLDAVAARLDADHHGLDDVKKRILEHMAVLKLSGNPKGTILCLAGPPAWARPPSASPSPTRRAAPSCASRSAACATRPRSAGTAAPTSAPSRAASSTRCARPR